MRKTSSFVTGFLQNPWFLFTLFCLVNGLLAFSNPDPGWRAALLGLGLALPMGLAVGLGRRTSTSKPLFKEDLFTVPPGWVLALLLLGAAFLRFTDLTGLSQWPLTDEAKNGYYAVQWAVRGKVRLLYDFSQLPPLYIWLEGLFFKVAGVSLFSLWCFPALLALATAAAAYPAARLHFPKSFSFLFAELMAFSFWPLYVGRFSNQGPLLLLWECLAFWMAGYLAKTDREKPGPTRSPFDSHSSLRGAREDAKGGWEEGQGGQREKNPGCFRGLIPGWGSGALKNGLALGLLAGAGFYTFPAWATVALVLALWVLCFRPKAAVLFLGGMAAAYLPLGTAALEQGYGGYIRYVCDFHPGQPWGPPILRGLWDFSSFFWKTLVPPNLFAYKPFWGGFLNPLLGACFFTGAAVFFRQASGPWIRFWTAAFLLFYLPGFLTGGLDMFRVLPLLPLLLAGAALGLAALLSSLRVSRRWPALALLLCASLALDGYHLFGAYGAVWSHPKGNWFGCKSLERLRAYGVLQKIAEKAGPGFVLCQLVPDLYDQSLPLAVYGFNAQENPGVSEARARWAALLTNIHYQAFLQKQFPESRWFWLAPESGQADGGLALGVFPFPCSRPQILERWIRADRAMEHRVVPLTFDFHDYKSRQPVIGELRELHPLFQGDRFLESCYWEKIAENEYGDRDYDAQIGALKQAVEKGIPAAHLYNDLAALYFRRDRLPEARKAFRKALACRPNHSSAAAGLELLEKTEKTGQLPKD